MPLKKLEYFTKRVSDLSDKPNATMTATEVKAQFDAAPDEVRQYLNNVIDALQSDVGGDSGADQIGAKPFSTSPNTVQGILEWLKTQMDGVVLGQIPDGTVVKPIEFNEHKTEKASLTTLGHVKAETDAEGNLILPELAAANVTTTQGSTVQETLDVLKLDTDSKIGLVRDAIISKGGAVTGNPPTAGELVAGVNSLSIVVNNTVAMLNEFSSYILKGFGEGKVSYYKYVAGGYSAVSLSANATMILNIPLDVTLHFVNKDVYCERRTSGSNFVYTIFDHKKTLLSTTTIVSGALSDYANYRKKDGVFMIVESSRFLCLYSLAGNLLVRIDTSGSNILDIVLNKNNVMYGIMYNSFGDLNKVYINRVDSLTVSGYAFTSRIALYNDLSTLI